MAYSTYDAIAALKQTFLWQYRSLAYDPLQGLRDGLNRVFKTSYAPISSYTVYDANQNAISSGFTVDDTTGAVVFTDAPVVGNAFYASYTAGQFSDSQLLGLAVIGFQEMSNRYPRSWYLVSSSGSDFVSSGISAVVDPVISGTLTFSQSPVQKQAYLTAVQYVWQSANWLYASGNYYRYKENRAGGLDIDRSRQSDALDKATAFMSQRLDDALYMAALEMGVQVGAFIPGATSTVYQQLYAWWPNQQAIWPIV